MAVDIRSRGVQAKHLIEIRDQLNAGVRMSHILNIKLTGETTSDQAYIYEILKREIWNVQLNEVVNYYGQIISVQITWTMPNAERTCAYYYTDCAYNDEIVALHTKSALRRITQRIRRDHQNYGATWGIAYLLTKPLNYLKAIESIQIDAEEGKIEQKGK
jgi:hypothetical protein